MHKETKADINNIIDQIEYWKSRQHVVKNSRNIDPEELKTKLDYLLDSEVCARKELDAYLGRIFARNYDISIQRSVNYYRRKAGLETTKITAIM